MIGVKHLRTRMFADCSWWILDSSPPDSTRNQWRSSFNTSNCRRPQTHKCYCCSTVRSARSEHTALAPVSQTTGSLNWGSWRLWYPPNCHDPPKWPPNLSWSALQFQPPPTKGTSSAKHSSSRWSHRTAQSNRCVRFLRNPQTHKCRSPRKQQPASCTSSS